jgi:hypothetical protein
MMVSFEILPIIMLNLNFDPDPVTAESKEFVIKIPADG